MKVLYGLLHHLNERINRFINFWQLRKLVSLRIEVHIVSVRLMVAVGCFEGKFIVYELLL